MKHTPSQAATDAVRNLILDYRANNPSLGYGEAALIVFAHIVETRCPDLMIDPLEKRAEEIASTQEPDNIDRWRVAKKAALAGLREGAGK